MIEFLDDPREFHGGNAAVEQAFIWVPLSDDKDNEGGPEHTSDEPTSPDGVDIKSDGHAEETECEGRDKGESQASDSCKENSGDNDDRGETEENDEHDHEVGDEEEELNSEDVERKVGSVTSLPTNPLAHRYPSFHLHQAVAVKKIKIADDTDLERVLGVNELHLLITG